MKNEQKKSCLKISLQFKSCLLKIKEKSLVKLFSKVYMNLIALHFGCLKQLISSQNAHVKELVHIGILEVDDK